MSGSDWISEAQYKKAAKTKQSGSINNNYGYEDFITSISDAQISSKPEAAKYLAHVIWETHGLQYTREVYCQDSNNRDACIRAYGQGSNGAIYYGRGPLQLSHDYNYRDASKAIFAKSNVLLDDPDRVAREAKAGWDTAAYFWRRNVHGASGSFEGSLGKINGALEGEGGPNAHIGRQRKEHYKDILDIVGLDRSTP